VPFAAAAPAPDVLDLRALAVAVATEAGELALRLRRVGVEVAATKSSLVDVVTAADREVEAFVRMRLEAARPEDGFFGEESDATGGTSGLTWIVDPIDGTVNYLYDLPRWAVSIAVAEGVDPASWRVLAGAVVNPSSGEVFAAALGAGATRNGAPIAASPATELAISLAATGFGYRAEDRLAQVAALGHVIAEIRDIRRAGAASLDLCDVACGRLDAYWERGLKPWDFAAASLVCTEAGAAVDASAVTGGRRLVTAATLGIAEVFSELLVRAGA